MKQLLKNRKQFKHTSQVLNESLEQINTKSGRYYKTPAGKTYPSVTTVVGMLSIDAIMAWRKRVGAEEANKISQKATSRGTRIHSLCEDYLNNAEIDGKKYSIIDVDNFTRLKKVFDEKIDNIRLQEVRMYSDYLQLAGTVDCVADYDGKLSIIDFKTSTKLKDKDYILGYFCQAAAYAVMYEERTGTPISQIVIIISVDDEMPQIFVDKRDNYIEKLLEIREKYREKHGV